MKALMEKLAELKKKNGMVDGAILIDDAYHACNPARDHEWRATAIIDNGDGTFDLGSVRWDFEKWIEEENGGNDADDAGDYPWDGNGYFKTELEGLTIADKDEIDCWIGSEIS